MADGFGKWSTGAAGYREERGLRSLKFASEKNHDQQRGKHFREQLVLDFTGIWFPRLFGVQDIGMKLKPDLVAKLGNAQ